MKTSVPRRAIVRRGPDFAVLLLLELDPFAVPLWELAGPFAVKISWPGLGFESQAGV
jgi:hypothetical protein